MKVFVVGLGLIGGSYAEGLKKAGHTIYGYDQDQVVLNEAIKLNIIEVDTDLKNISQVDLVILCLYPLQNIQFIKENQHLFTKKQLITDVSGTKVFMLNEIKKVLPKGIRYVSHHPMAGKEKKGFFNRDIEMFSKANFIIIDQKKKSKDIALLEHIAQDLKFSNILIVSAKKHDELIAFTSQLTHVLAVSLVNSDQMLETKEATGDSYRDLTRIAKINEIMWTELFIENKKALLKKIKDFKKELMILEQAIKSDDKSLIMRKLVAAREKRQSFDKN